MEKCIIWYVLSLKENIIKRGSWLAVFGMLFLVWIADGIQIPDYENMKIGICDGGSETAKQITAELLREKGAFDFLEYQNKEKLKLDVKSGRLDCGFIFTEDFEEKIKEINSKDMILYYATPFSSKGEVAKEKVYTAFFKIYSEQLLTNSEAEIFGGHEEERMRKLLQKNQTYQESNAVFQIQIEEVQGETFDNDKEKQWDAISGLIGLFIFLTMFLAYGRTQQKVNDKVEAALNRPQRWCYRYIKMLAAAFLPTVIGSTVILNRPKSRGFCMEILCLTLFILLGALWISIFGSILRKAENLTIWILVLLLMHLFICPLFFDLSEYVPAVAWIRYLLPLSWYQMW